MRYRPTPPVKVNPVQRPSGRRLLSRLAFLLDEFLTGFYADDEIGFCHFQVPALVFVAVVIRRPGNQRGGGPYSRLYPVTSSCDRNGRAMDAK
jgi:hypothetical protein